MPKDKVRSDDEDDKALVDEEKVIMQTMDYLKKRLEKIREERAVIADNVSLSSRSSGKQAMSATQSRLSRRTKKLEVQVHEQLRQGRMADRKRLSNYSRF